MYKDLIIKLMKEMEYEVEDIPNQGYVFKNQEVEFIYMPDKDKDLIRFALPPIFEVSDENRHLLYKIINEVNFSTKYTKVCMGYDKIWVFSERRIFNRKEITSDLIANMLAHLIMTSFTFYDMINGDTDYK